MCKNIIRTGENGERGGTEGTAREKQTLDPDQQESYKFLGVEQADGIKTREAYESAKEEVKSRINITYKIRT